ncbi:conserved exported hypothetical protein [Bradyrhizobium sp. ORS 375]|uniref:hypothetical protein n=1 Tax=Bradyrhizobium sp. (strain ORS 375) TaxID=566679 RepID=UPI00024064FE|nr:hypothetical protein [Bradyrhizobium sp. ORS 375]CCD96701.1 conserved exported hypothetical protein [Bradyrhizobium sp. ORS 375]
MINRHSTWALWALAVAIVVLPTVPGHADDKSVGASQPANPAASSGSMVGGFRPPESCLKEFTPLRDEAARRAQLLKMTPGRRFAPGEACRLVHDYELAQTKMIEYAVAHASTCGIPAKITDQLKANHENTLTVMRKVCTVTWNTAPAVRSFTLSALGSAS